MADGNSSKRAKVDKDAPNPVEDAKLQELSAIQESMEKLDSECVDEIMGVEAKYNKLKRPHADKRKSVIAQIPKFWLTALQNHPILASTLSHAEDSECLAHLVDVDVEENEDAKRDFSIVMTFSENPYFTNTQLRRDVMWDDDGQVTVKSTKIDWKAGKDLTNGGEVSGSQKRDEPEPSSFFSWLCDDDEADPDAELERIIKEELWANPLRYYCGTYSDDEFDEGEDGEEDEDENEDEEAEEAEEE